MNQDPQVTAVILAGGMGRRMGGKDKGLVALEGRPLIAHVIDTVAPQVSHILLNANRNGDDYAQFGYPVIADDLEGFQGPLAGILAAMQHAVTPLLLVVPCDAPQLPQDLVLRLSTTMRSKDAQIAVAHDGERLQPVHALLACSLASDLEDWLKAGERKIDGWYARHDMASVDFSDHKDSFLNVNTLAERNQLEKRGLTG